MIMRSTIVKPTRIPKKSDDSTLTYQMKTIYNCLIDFKDNNRSLISAFMSLPSKEEFPDYYRIVDKPVSMTEIRQNIERETYKDFVTMLKDFGLMFSNSLLYSSNNESIVNDVIALQNLIGHYDESGSIFVQPSTSRQTRRTATQRPAQTATRSTNPPLKTPKLEAPCFTKDETTTRKSDPSSPLSSLSSLSSLDDVYDDWKIDSVCVFPPHFYPSSGFRLFVDEMLRMSKPDCLVSQESDYRKDRNLESMWMLCSVTKKREYIKRAKAIYAKMLQKNQPPSKLKLRRRVVEKSVYNIPKKVKQTVRKTTTPTTFPKTFKPVRPNMQIQITQNSPRNKAGQTVPQQSSTPIPPSTLTPEATNSKSPSEPCLALVEKETPSNENMQLACSSSSLKSSPRLANAVPQPFCNLSVSCGDFLQSPKKPNSDFLYEIQFHDAKPEFADKYIDLYELFCQDLVFKSKDKAELVASFRVEIGNQDQFIHIWRYREGYKQLSQIHQTIRADQHLSSMNKKMTSMLYKRENHIMMAFSFWECAEPQILNSCYEMQSYLLKPGTMKGWVNTWSRDLCQRENSVAGFFSQIGQTYTVHHIWRYQDLQVRKASREEAWKQVSWHECVSSTVSNIVTTQTRWMMPNRFSPIR